MVYWILEASVAVTDSGYVTRVDTPSSTERETAVSRWSIADLCRRWRTNDVYLAVSRHLSDELMHFQLRSDATLAFAEYLIQSKWRVASVWREDEFREAWELIRIEAGVKDLRDLKGKTVCL